MMLLIYCEDCDTNLASVSRPEISANDISNIKSNCNCDCGGPSSHTTDETEISDRTKPVVINLPSEKI